MKAALPSILLALVALTISAYSSVTLPGLSIPFTAQSLVVFVIAALLSPRHFLIIIIGYILLGAVGAPVFADGSSGFERIMGNSGGFLYGFVFSGLLISISNHKSNPQFYRLTLNMLMATVVLFIFGVGHLSAKLDIAKGLQFGLYPYWKMAIVKALLAAIIVYNVRIYLPIDQNRAS